MARLDPTDRPAIIDDTANDETAAGRNCARRLGLPFTTHVDLGPNAYSDLDAIASGTIAMGRGIHAPAFIAPADDTVPTVGQWMTLHPSARGRLSVSTPTAIRAALRQAGRRGYHRLAERRLESIAPSMSARRTVTITQLAAGFALLALTAAAFVFAPVATILIVDLIAACFFLGVTLLRFAAAGHVPLRLRRPLTVADNPDLPVYTVLVPILHEAHIVPQLVAALARLDWPADRLDIKLIVEEDDLPTRAAAMRATSGAPFEVIVVPGGGPRTKPMALQYALTFARGEFVTIYDAEDRPHPGQLREAFATFLRSDGRLACLQAPIVIDNARAGRLARLFAVEYSTIFDGLLPALALYRLPLPLGGTSNHFRRGPLEEVGGWDPYNVTEDAELGIRLARFGYDAATITLPTYEEAPATLGPWVRQRTRWFKGWMQTWLVHMRHPVRAGRELGLRSLLCFNLVGLGMIVSAVAHPVFVATPFVVATNPLGLWENRDLFGAAVVGLNLFNLVAGYLAVTILANRTLGLRERRQQLSVLSWLPIYWILMGIACMRATWQLIIRPHKWEKTPHVGHETRPRHATATVIQAPLPEMRLRT